MSHAADVEVEVTLLHKETEKPFFPDGPAVHPAKNRLPTVVLQRLPCASPAISEVESLAPDVSLRSKSSS